MNDIIFTNYAKAVCMYVKNFYLGTPIQDPSEYEYLKIHIIIIIK